MSIVNNRQPQTDEAWHWGNMTDLTKNVWYAWTAKIAMCDQLFNANLHVSPKVKPWQQQNWGYMDW